MSGNFSVPSNTHPVLTPDGRMNRVWYNYLQSLSGVAFGPQVDAVAAEAKHPTRPDPGIDVAEPSQDVSQAASHGAARVGSSEHDLEPPQGPSHIIAIVEQVLGNEGVGSQTVTDGTNTVTSALKTTFVGATVSGSTPDAVVTIATTGRLEQLVAVADVWS